MTIYWTSEDCHGQAIFTLHLSVGQVIIFPYFDHWIWAYSIVDQLVALSLLLHISTSFSVLELQYLLVRNEERLGARR